MDEIRSKNELDIKREIRKSNVKDFLMVLLGTVIYSLSTYVFVLGNGFAPSGLSGILAMIEYAYNLSAGTFVLLLLNAPLLIWSFFWLSKRFAINSTVAVSLMCLIFFIMKYVDQSERLRFITTSVIEGSVYPDFGKKLFSCIIAGGLAGFSAAMTIRAHGCLGGVDLVLNLIQKKKPRANVSGLLFGLNFIIIAVSFFVFEKNYESICFALIYTIIYSKVCEYILNGGKKALKFEVITDNPDKLSDELIQKLGHSVTVTRAQGMFEHSDKYLLICVIRSRQIGDFENILKKYPDTFAYASPVSEVFGTFYR